MALDLGTLKQHCNIVDDTDNAVLARVLSAATRHVECVLGFALDDESELPDGVPADLDQAVLMLAAHWYENREATLIGISGHDVPFGVSQILGEHRRYTFG